VGIAGRSPLWKFDFGPNFLFPSIGFREIINLECDMGWYFSCAPSFDNMDFMEFLEKYDNLRARVEKKNSSNVDMIKIFSGMFGGNKK
jgi:hypothetical protein